MDFLTFIFTFCEGKNKTLRRPVPILAKNENARMDFVTFILPGCKCANKRGSLQDDRSLVERKLKHLQRRGQLVARLVNKLDAPVVLECHKRI